MQRTPRPNAGGDTTRSELVDAAEELIADRGVEVSLREIAAAAGQRKTNAVQYHFGDREGLVGAVLLARGAPSDQRRQAILAEGEGTYEDLARALVEPLAADLDRQGQYVRFLHRLSVSRSGQLPFAPHLDPAATAGFREIVDLLHHRTDSPGSALVRVRVQLAVDFVVMALAYRAAVERQAARVQPSRRVFVEELVRSTAGVLGGAIDKS